LFAELTNEAGEAPMRLLLLLLCLAPPLFAIDLEDVDRDTLRYVRLALLKDEVRKHFGLRIGEFESLDQALTVNLGGSPLLLVRLGQKAAAVRICTEDKTDTADVHLFIEVETRIEAAPLLDDAFVAVRCLVSEDGPQKTRLLRIKDGKLQLCLAWISVEQRELERGRYEIRTTRTLAGPTLKLIEKTEYLLDGKRVDGALAERKTTMDDTAEALTFGAVQDSPISVTQHCAIARRLERDALNEAALHHAHAALDQAKAERLADDDARCLEAQALSAKLEARLRPIVVEGDSSGSGK
jgi:hypothetical protein